MIAVYPFDEVGRAGAGKRRHRVGCVAIDNVEVFEEVKRSWAWLIGAQNDGVLVGRFDAGEPVALQNQGSGGNLRIAHVQHVPFDIVARELAPRVELHTFPQVQLELFEVATELPAFSQHGRSEERRVGKESICLSVCEQYTDTITRAE